MAIDDPDSPWAFTDPWTITHPRHPVVDDASAAVLDEAVVTLTLLRSPMQLGDCLAHLHALVSLLAQINASLPIVVGGARDQDHCWDDIAAQLGVTAETVRRRYRPHGSTSINTR